MKLLNQNGKPIPRKELLPLLQDMVLYQVEQGYIGYTENNKLKFYRVDALNKPENAQKKTDFPRKVLSTSAFKLAKANESQAELDLLINLGQPASDVVKVSKNASEIAKACGSEMKKMKAIIDEMDSTDEDEATEENKQE